MDVQQSTAAERGQNELTMMHLVASPKKTVRALEPDVFTERF